MILKSEQIGMGTGIHQGQGEYSIVFTVTQKPTRPNVQLSRSSKTPRQLMVAKFLVKRNIVTKFFDNILKFLYRKPPLFTTFIRFFEPIRPDNFVNHLSKSAHISSMFVYRLVFGFVSKALASSMASFNSLEYLGYSTLKGKPRCKTNCRKKSETACDMERPRPSSKVVASLFSSESIRKFFATVPILSNINYLPYKRKYLIAKSCDFALFGYKLHPKMTIL